MKDFLEKMLKELEKLDKNSNEILKEKENLKKIEIKLKKINSNEDFIKYLKSNKFNLNELINHCFIWLKLAVSNNQEQQELLITISYCLGHLKKEINKNIEYEKLKN